MLSRLIAILSLMSGIVASGFVWFEYQAHQHAQRVNRTLEYFNRFHNHQEVYLHSEEISEAFSDKVWDLFCDGEVDRLEVFLVNSIQDDEELRKAGRTLVRFYDSVAICLSEELCDRGSVEAHFADRMRSANSLFQPWLTERRRRYFVSDGLPLLDLVRSLPKREVDQETVCEGA